MKISGTALPLAIAALALILPNSAGSHEFDLRNTAVGKEADSLIQDVRKRFGQGNEASAGWTKLTLNSKTGTASGDAFLRNRHIPIKGFVLYDATVRGSFKADVNQGNVDVVIHLGPIALHLTEVANVRGDILRALSGFARDEAVKATKAGRFAFSSKDVDGYVEATEPDKRLGANVTEFSVKDDRLVAKCAAIGPCVVATTIPLGDKPTEIRLHCNATIKVTAEAQVTSHEGLLRIKPKCKDLDISIQVNKTDPPLDPKRQKELSEGINRGLNKHRDEIIKKLNADPGEFTLK